MRRRVRPLDVDHEQVGALPLPEVQADPAVAVRRRERPAEVAEIVVEVEGTAELLGADVHERLRLLEGDVARPAHERGHLRLQLGRVDGGRGVARAAHAVGEQEMVAGVVAHDRAVHGLGRPGRPPPDDRDPAPGIAQDVPQRLHAPHAARHRKVLSRGGVDGHEVADAVLVGGFPGGDRRPDDGAEERLGADEPPVRALLPERREVRELALGHEEVDDLGVHAVEPEHEDARRGRRRAAGAHEGQDGHDERTDARAHVHGRW